MFLRIVGDGFARRPRGKILAAAVLALGMAIATATVSVSLDVGDRLAREFRSLGANLLVTPQADSLPLEIGGVDYRPVNAGAYLPEGDLPKLKTIFWRHNIVGFAPMLEVPVQAWTPSSQTILTPRVLNEATLIGTWSQHNVALPDGGSIITGVEKTNPWWRVEGRWFSADKLECVVGAAFARRNRMKAGDVLHLSAGGHTRRLTLTATGILSTGGDEDQAIVAPLALAQQLAGTPGQYRRLYVSALTKPEDAFARQDPAKMTPGEYDRWFCTPYVSSIALQIRQALPGTDARPIRRVAEGEGRILTRVRSLMWLVTLAALFASALAVGATSAATVLERRVEVGLMKALGGGTRLVASFLAAEQILLALVGGALGYAGGIGLARLLGQSVFGVVPEQPLLVLPLILVLAILVTLAGSLLSLRHAAQEDPAAVLRGE
jgi:putative ABC transport system permease protein